MVVPRNEIIENAYTAIASELDQQELICTSLSLGHFFVTETEIASQEQVREDVHKAMLLKLFRQSDGQHSFSLPSLPIFIHGILRQASECEEGNVVYVDVISEKADCKSTLMNVLGKLHKTSII